MRIVASGCSFTYGHGLQDCFTPPLGYGPNPSEFAWPKVLANLTGRECINVSAPGGGNIRIIKQMLEVDLIETDTVTILWSYSTRSPEFTTTGTSNHGEWDDNYMRNKFNFSCPHDLYIQQLISVYLFTKYLESKKVNIIYQFIDRFELDKHSVHYPLFSKLWGEIEKYDYTQYTFDVVQKELREGTIKGYALDGNHPNEEWHKKLGEYVYKIIYKNSKTII